MLRIADMDVSGLAEYAERLSLAGDKASLVLARAINHTGPKARTQVIRALAKQTSLPQKTIRAAVRQTKASTSTLVYRLDAAGGDVALKFFKPRETRQGVSAFVRGQRQLFDRTFLKGGSFASGRVPLKMGGQVFLRIGRRTDLERQTSGVVIPAEMVDGASAKAFEETVEGALPGRIEHELARLL